MTRYITTLSLSVEFDASDDDDATRVAEQIADTLSFALRGEAMSGYSTSQIVRATTASAMTVQQWEHVWTLAAPVIVAAGRFLDVEQEGNPKLTLDAHFQLLKAVTDYRRGLTS